MSSPAVTPLTHHKPNAQLLELIPLSASLVFEVGCGSGATGEVYLRRNPSAQYVGLEISADYAKIAKKHISACHVGNIENIDILSLTGGIQPDCIVFGDVLEHLNDPWELVKKLKAVVHPQGCIVACVPNVGHWSIIGRLLAGQWNYTDTGLLDRTHLRFFTRKTFIQLFTQAGMDVCDVRSRQKMPPKDERFIPAMLELSQRLDIQNPQLEAELNTMQWLIRATPEKTKPLIVHAKPHRPIGGMSDVRLTLPLRALLTEPGVKLGYVNEQMKNLHGEKDADNLFIWQRPLSTQQSRDVVQRYAAQGLATIIEFDDEPSLWPENVADDFKIFSQAIATQTATPVLKTKFESLGAQTAFFENAIFELPEPPLPTPRGPNGCVNIFFGALNRQADWALYMDAFNEVLANVSVPVHVSVVFDQAFFDAVKTDQKTFSPLCNYTQFHQHLHTSDIAWLPLENNEKNRCKSDLKFIESAAHGVAVLASPVVYERSIVHGETGLVYQSLEEFKWMLKYLIEQEVFRAAMGTTARKYVAKSRMLAFQNRKRLQWYRECCEQFGRLAV